MKNYNKKKGFTIVELVIVVAVVGILTAVLVPTFVNLVNKANQSADEALVKNLNTQLRINEQTEGKNKTMSEAIGDVKEAGYLLENLTPRGSSDIVWNQEADEFALLGSAPSENAYKYWKIYEKKADIPATQTYSVYAAGTDWSTVPELVVGLDVGENTNISTINYTNTGAARKVVFRTNGGTLTIDGVNDTVKHYGSAKLIDINKVSGSSYYEYGEALTARIAKGRIVVTEDSEIGGIKAVATDGEFTDIKVAVVGDAELPVISRDEANVDNETTEGTHSQVVIEVQNLDSEGETPSSENTEYVWATVTVNGSGEITSTGTEVASSGTELNEETRIDDPAIAESVVTPVKVTTADELTAAVASDAKYILLANNITYAGPVGLTHSVTIDGGGFTLTSTGGAANEAIDDVTTGWKVYRGVIEVQAANVDVKISNINLVNNRSVGTAITFFRTATNINVEVENTYLDAPQYCVYAHVGSAYQNIILKYVSFNPNSFNAVYWRGANGTFNAAHTTFASTNSSTAETNGFTTFAIERPLLIGENIFQSSGNVFIFSSCTFKKAQLGNQLQTLMMSGSENNTIYFNETDFDSTGLIQFAGKMSDGTNVTDMAASHIYVNGVESMPINAGHILVQRYALTDGRVFWSEWGAYDGVYSFDISLVTDIMTGYHCQNNGNGTWSVVAD